MGKVAILTIAYNSEKYLEKCVNSVLKQTYSDFTYYLCDNGSNDETRALIDKFAQNDSRIFPVYIDVNSLTNTFNQMLRTIYSSDCKYLSILDSDDWYEPDFLKETIIKMDDEQVDICLIGSNFIRESTMKIEHKRVINKELIITHSQIPDYFIYLHQFFRTTWGKLYRIDVLRSKTILVGKYEYGADTVFALECLRNSNNIAVLDKILHNYLVRNTSDSYVYRTDRLKSDIYLYEYPMSILSEFGPISNLNKAFMYNVLSISIKDSLTNLILSDIDIEQKSQKILEFFENNYARESWDFLDNVDDYIYETLSLEYYEKDIINFFENMLTWIIKYLDNTVGDKKYTTALILSNIMSNISALLKDEKNFIQSNIYKYFIAEAMNDELKIVEYKNFLNEMGVEINTK